MKELNRLGAVLKEQGISQVDFAEKLKLVDIGATTQYINNVVKNRTNPSLKRLEVFARVLNVPMHTLISSYKKKEGSS
jgi:transcriptional regulator with XRE-family HTH domain